MVTKLRYQLQATQQCKCNRAISNCFLSFFLSFSLHLECRNHGLVGETPELLLPASASQSFHTSRVQCWFNAGSRSLLQAVMQRKFDRNPTSYRTRPGTTSIPVVLAAISGDCGCPSELTWGEQNQQLNCPNKRTRTS